VIYLDLFLKCITFRWSSICNIFNRRSVLAGTNRDGHRGLAVIYIVKIVLLFTQEEADKKRRTDFKRYEMEKKFEHDQRLQHIEDEERRKEEERRMKELVCSLSF